MTFDSQDEADAFVAKRAKKPKGMFVMAKDALYHRDTLTLTVSDRKNAGPIIADELFYLTRAAGVLPLGNNRYRISTRMSFLEVAQVFNFSNRYLKGDNNKYSVLRDDRDRYVLLDTEAQPKSVLEYFRLDPPDEISLFEAEQQLFWYKLANLPHGLGKQEIISALCELKGGPGDGDIVDAALDASTYSPSLTFSLREELIQRHSFMLEGRIVVLLPVDPPLEKPQDVDSGHSKHEAPRPCADLDAVVTGEQWAPRKAISSFVERKYKNKRRMAVRVIAQRDPSQCPEGGSPQLAGQVTVHDKIRSLTAWQSAIVRRLETLRNQGKLGLS